MVRAVFFFNRSQAMPTLHLMCGRERAQVACEDPDAVASDVLLPEARRLASRPRLIAAGRRLDGTVTVGSLLRGRSSARVMVVDDPPETVPVTVRGADDFERRLTMASRADAGEVLRAIGRPDHVLFCGRERVVSSMLHYSRPTWGARVKLFVLQKVETVFHMRDGTEHRQEDESVYPAALDRLERSWRAGSGLKRGFLK